MKLKFYLKFLLLVVITNLLYACSNPNGVDVPVTDWISGTLFGWTETDPGNFGGIFSTIASVIGGPYGWAAGIIGTAVPAFVKTRKTNKGIKGVVEAMQAARATLKDEDRKAFDDAAREVMNDAKGDPRKLVRSIKSKIKSIAFRKGEKIMPSLSAKHPV